MSLGNVYLMRIQMQVELSNLEILSAPANASMLITIAGSFRTTWKLCAITAHRLTLIRCCVAHRSQGPPTTMLVNRACPASPPLHHVNIASDFSQDGC